MYADELYRMEGEMPTRMLEESCGERRMDEAAEGVFGGRIGVFCFALLARGGGSA